MGTEPNPSVVNDASGSNYNISSGGSMGEAQMQYLDNLQRLAMKAPPRPLGPDQYMPGAAQGIQRGSYSSQATGSVPLFAASNLIPFAMMDEAKRSQAEAEAQYYNKLKPYLDKPLIDAKLKLANPWAQPEFASKIQDITDKVTESYANKLGGNYMMAHIAASQDKDFNRTLQRAGEYANIYNNVYAGALDTLTKAKDPLNYYVSPARIKSITDFIHAHDSLDTLSIDELAKKGEEYQAKDSIFKLAEAATAKIKEDVVDEYSKSPAMSTQQEDVWVKNKITGSKGQAEEIVANVVKANPWLKDDSTQLDLLKTEIDNQVKFGTEKSIEKITKDNAARDQELTKYGIKTDPQGDIMFPNKPAALINATGTNAVNYRTEGAKPIPSVVGMTGYIVANGRTRFVKLPESYQMLPQSEYDITDASSGVAGGRYVESKINFQSVGPYKPDDTRALTAKGQLVGQYSLGTDRGSEEKLPASLQDAITGEQIQVYGEQTILTPFDQMKGTVEGNIPYMGYVHDKLEASYGPYTKRKENLDKGGNKLNSQAQYAKPIEVPKGADSSVFKDDPYQKYNWNGRILTGKEAWDIIGR